MGHRELDVASFRAWLSRARDEITRSRQRLNDENLYPVADADTGSNLEATIRAASEAVDAESSDQLHVVADAAADGALHGAQGNSGVLLSQILRGFADGLRENLPKAYALAHERALKAVADPKEGTILSVARAAKEATSNIAAWGSEVRRDGEIALAAWRAARASTLDSAKNPPSEASRGTIDAGAHGIELIYRSLVAVLDDESESLTDLPAQEHSDRMKVQETAPSDGAFEVMYELFDISEEKIEQLRKKLSGIGKSLLVVGEAKFWKVHVHTDFVEETITFAKEIGRPENIRITSLEASECKSERTLITVANGPGFKELMSASGISVISAFESRRVAAQEWNELAGESGEVILIPHDPHGHESAVEALGTLRKMGKRVAVINSRSPLQAIAAISTHSDGLNSEFDSEVSAMQGASAHTRSITIAYSPRHMNIGDNQIEAGSVIALNEGVIVEFGNDVIEVAHRAISRVAGDTCELVTLVTGAKAPTGIAEKLTDLIHEARPSLEVATYFGGQAWYPLLIGIE